MKKTQVTLIRHSAILYPYKDEDFEHLSDLGTPITKIEHAYFPVLEGFASNVKFKIIDMVDLEAQMMVKFNKLWVHECEYTAKTITLSFPRNTPEALTKKATDALRKWYREHYIQLDEVIKRNGKIHKIILTKRLVV